MEHTPDGVPGPTGARTPHLSWSSVPSCRDGVLVAAFEGWNDAGDAATTAVGHLVAHLRARTFAVVDPDDFFDFTINRPEVRLTGGARELHWPETTLAVGRGERRDLVLLEGIEPHLRWRTYCSELLAVAEALGVRQVITLGALLAEVPHTRPVPVYGTADDPVRADELGLETSTYEGPTGIVGVLGSLAAAAGFRTASFWAAVPTYASGSRSPKAALALVERVARFLDITVPTVELEIASAAYERQVSALVDEDDDTAAWVARLEEDHDREQGELSNAGTLVEEVERFLRNQDG
ncbi:MAG: PAC2 family protein [Acidimicrobiales bacterium]|jgi:proteasome assembly chaperone (PAC2) family protein|nr:PAC2 family protein [Acidimicrobiales bacterium]